MGQGDRGGPFACNGKLTGVVSFGIGCANADFPGVYTRIQHFKDWIANNLEPEETTPMETTQKETTPMETTQKETTPMETTQKETTPMETTPMDTTQKETTQMETSTEQQTTPTMQTTTSSASFSMLNIGTIFIPFIQLILFING